MNEFEIIAINENSFRIETPMVRAYLFTGNDKALLIDTTMTDGDIAAAIRTVTDLPVILLNTHCDPDHIACNNRFEQTLIHPMEFDLYKANSKEGFAAPAAINDGDVIDLGGRCFEVIHIPGHTFGSIALLNKEEKFLVSGDSIGVGPIFMFGETRNLNSLIESLTKLKGRMDSFDKVYTSHGDFCLPASFIDNILKCADELKKGKLSPEEPPFPLPAKMFRSNGAAFFYTI